MPRGGTPGPRAGRAPKAPSGAATATAAATARSEHSTIRVALEGAVALVELHRPETLNAFNMLMAKELGAELRTIAADDEVRAVVLTGAGRGFSSGLDLIDSGLPTLPSGRPDARTALLEVFNPLVLLLREMPQPVVAAVNGVAAGIGVSMALACDLVLAARSASFVLSFVNIGLVPDGGASLLVTARAGAGRALEMSLLGDPIGAELALDWGLVNRVEDDERLLTEAIELARRRRSANARIAWSASSDPARSACASASRSS